MSTKTLSNEFMQNIATEEAWKELSCEFNWDEILLEKYQDKVNWNEISGNTEICWTIPMLQKFQKKINWDILSDRNKAKDVDLNPADQGKTLAEMYEIKTGKKLSISDLLH